MSTHSKGTARAPATTPRPAHSQAAPPANGRLRSAQACQRSGRSAHTACTAEMAAQDRYPQARPKFRPAPSPLATGEGLDQHQTADSSLAYRRLRARPRRCRTPRYRHGDRPVNLHEYTFLFGTGNARTCRIEFVILAVTPIAGHGGKVDRREPRPGRSGCHRGPGSTVRSSPRAPLRMTGTSAAASRACSV